jgi:hypothetical protein
MTLACSMTAQIFSVPDGIALSGNYVALPEIRGGSLVVPLPDFPVPDLWIKAMAPISLC